MSIRYSCTSLWSLIAVQRYLFLSIGHDSNSKNASNVKCCYLLQRALLYRIVALCHLIFIYFFPSCHCIEKCLAQLLAVVILTCRRSSICDDKSNVSTQPLPRDEDHRRISLRVCIWKKNKTLQRCTGELCTNVLVLRRRFYPNCFDMWGS